MLEKTQLVTLNGTVYSFPASAKTIEVIEGNPHVGDEMMVLNYDIVNGEAVFRNITYRIMEEEELNRLPWPHPPI
jgi:hypothetical protein